MAGQISRAQKLFGRIAAPITKGSRRPVAASVRNKLYATQGFASELERKWKDLAVEAEAGGDAEAVNQAEAELFATRREIARLEAVLATVEAAEADDARAAQKAREDAQDAEQVAAYQDVTKAARAVAAILPDYGATMRTLAEAEGRARLLALANPRTRQDLLTPQPIAHLVSVELARISAGQTPPPGADQWTAMVGDARKAVPLTDHFDALVRAVREHLNHD